ncbi:Peptidase family M50 [Planctomycetes bacterium CA13]|uniref:Peptidase family M50 n=1 Tax=Novipirellula herctigrandis TaxID=2527986 RepID=A0A5C5Z004_9BACT|nr:Peptidase family M50 [Planctomycetes bacterium CA13]
MVPSPPSSPLIILDSDVRFVTRDIGGRTTYVAHHQATGKFFQFGPQEYRIATLLDGIHSITDIQQALATDGIDWSGEDVAKFIAQLVRSQLALVKGELPAPLASQSTAPSVTPPIQTSSSSRQGTSSKQDIPAEPKPTPQILEASPPTPPPETSTPPTPSSPHSPSTSPAPHASGLTRLISFLPLLICQRIPLFRGDRFATRLEKHFGRSFSPMGMVLWGVLVASGLMLVYGHWHAFMAEIRQLFDPQLWPIMTVIWIFSKAIHESGHATCAKHHGVKVGGIGITFFFLAPLAYVDVTDAWRLKSRFKRVQIALGGVYWELAIASIAAWAWWFMPDGYMKHLSAQIFLISGPATLLVNANPLLRLDGYYVLSDLTDIPNLRMHGRRDLGSYLERVFFGIPQSRSLLSGWRSRFAMIHAACSIVFQFFWMGGLIIGVAYWAQGLGMLLAVAAAVMWFALPTVRWLYRVWTYAPSEYLGLNHYRRRLLLHASFLIVLLQHLGTYSSPLDRRVPVVVRFQDEQIARSPSDAFVQSVFVERGQYVERGTVLMQLTAPETVVRRDKKLDDFELATMMAVQMRRQGELSKAASHAENAESLHRQLDELDEQISQLTVVASRKGYVEGRQIATLPGRFVSQGFELLRVCDPREKELLTVIPEDDVDAYQEAIASKAVARVRLRGGKRISTQPAALRPRAFQTLVHPAFAATSGGPLAVEPLPNDTNHVRLVQPHLESITPLDPITSAEVRSGQLGTMTIHDNRPLLSRWIESIKNGG